MRYAGISIIALIFLLGSCNSTTDNERKKIMVRKDHDTIIPQIAFDKVRPIPKLVFYKQTKGEGRGERIISKALRSDTLIIKITSIQNCGAKYNGDFKCHGDTLSLLIKQLPKIIKHKNGKTDTTYLFDESYCLYKFSFMIANMNCLPKTILLNGNKFRGEYKGL